MLALPILNVRLQACPESWQQMTPAATGRHCAHCDREVVDFTRATAADLAAARAAAPDGRLCGRFRQSQLAAAPPLRLRPKLRRFLVALVLVCGLGLTSREAWAQVRAKETTLAADNKAFSGYIEKMPEYRDGGIPGLLQFIAQNAHYPAGEQKSGKVFVDFVITTEGNIRDLTVMKGMGEPFDAEALRVVGLMGKWIPVKYEVHYTLPITFLNDSQPATQPKKKK